MLPACGGIAAAIAVARKCPCLGKIAYVLVGIVKKLVVIGRKECLLPAQEDQDLRFRIIVMDVAGGLTRIEILDRGLANHHLVARSGEQIVIFIE